jgi:predicted Asp-tRNA(Asn)/Glu-tRNA(Gln) amidotransferase subunit C
MDKKLIEKEAKKILDKFSSALDKAGIKDEGYEVYRKDFERDEGSGEKCEGFKESLLANAPNKDKDFIIAEKGAWKE